MKSRPSLLMWQSLFLLMIALALPAQALWLMRHTAWTWEGVQDQFSQLDCLLIGLALLSSFLAWRASKVLLYVLPLLLTGVLFRNWEFIWNGLTQNLPLAWAGAATGVLLICLPVVPKNIRLLLRFPEKRWWLTPMRHTVNVPVRLKLHLAQGSREFLAMTFDLSPGGAFIPLEMMAPTLESGERALPPTIGIGTQCYVSLPLRGLNRVTCRAEVVRFTCAQGQYPGGIGIRFLGLGWRARTALETFLEYRLTHGLNKTAHMS